MKIALKILTILFISYLTFSCQKNDAGNGVNYLRVMGGRYDRFSSGNMPDANKSIVDGNTQLTITASSNDEIHQVITLVIKNYTGATGTFTIVGVSGTAFAAYNRNPGATDILSSNPESSPGTLVITKKDKISKGFILYGTFSFTAGTYNFTSGTFQVFEGD